MPGLPLRHDRSYSRARRSIALLAVALLAVSLLASLAQAGLRWGANGTLVCDQSNTQSDPKVMVDDQGRTIIAWLDGRAGAPQVYAQRLDTDGTAMWADDGVQVCDTACTDRGYLDIVTDGSRGAILVWADNRAGNADWNVYAERVDSGGNLLWDPAGRDGVPVCTEVANQNECRPVIDGAGGAMVVWTDLRWGSDKDIYAQRLNSSGVRQWYDAGWSSWEGMLVCVASGDQYSPAPVYIGSGGSPGVITSWTDARNQGTSGLDIWAQKSDLVTGSGLWTPDGNVVCNAAGDQTSSATVPDQSQTGAVVTWLDARAGNDDIYAQRVNDTGTRQWSPANGKPVAEGAGDQKDPDTNSDNAGGAVVAFGNDTGTVTPRVQRIDYNGTLSWGTNLSGLHAMSGRPAITRVSTSGSYYIGWVDTTGPVTARVQCVSSAGAPQWGTDGRGTMNPDIDASEPIDVGAFNNPTYRAMIAFTAGSGHDLYAQCIDNARVTICSPASGTQGETLTVSIKGTETAFNDPAPPTVSLGAGVTVNSVDVKSAVWLDADVTVAPGASIGTRDVSVTNGNLIPAALEDGFVVDGGPPVVSSIEPDEAVNDQNSVEITNLAGQRFIEGAGVQLTMSGELPIDATGVQVVSENKITCDVPVKDAKAGAWDVTVNNPGGKTGTKSGAFTIKDPPTPPPPPVGPKWYLAEGSTAWGFNTYINIVNPNEFGCNAIVTFMMSSGDPVEKTIWLDPTSQTTIDASQYVGEADFSTVVECQGGNTIAVDRTMLWQASPEVCPEAHASVGVTEPATLWYLPEGSSAWGFECFLLIQNPNETDAHCTVTYMTQDSGPLDRDYVIPAMSRRTYNMIDFIGEKDASIRVVSDIPVIPERAMYRNARREGHESIGTTSAANDYYLAEGATAWGFTTFVLVQNPNESQATVTLTYMTPGGAVTDEPFVMQPNSRVTVKVNDHAPDKDLSTLVHSDMPIIAERAMYWDAGAGETCHDSIGLARAHRIFYFADGGTSPGNPETGEPDAETWTLVQNPNNSDVTIKMSYLGGSGTDDVVFEDVLPANSRRSYRMADRIPNGSASIVVESLTAGKSVMAERSMYAFSRGLGTDTIGGFAD